MKMPLLIGVIGNYGSTFAQGVGKIHTSIITPGTQCNDGTYSDATGRGACARHGGKKNNCAPCKPSENNCFSVWMDIKDIHTDEKRFQNREAKFSEESVQKIVNNYDINKLDPITVWFDTAAQKYYVLSGHSRLEATKKANKIQIPVRFFQGSEGEAMRYGKVDANRSGTAETLLEDINAFKLDRDGTDSIKPLSKEELKRKWAKNYNKLDSYTYLSKGAKFLDNLSSEARQGFPFIENRAFRVGLWRKYYPQLTRAHENEIFDYWYSVDGGKVTVEEMEDKINRIVSRIDFDSEQKLNLANTGKRGTDGRNDTSEAQARIYEIQKEIEKLLKTRREVQTKEEKNRINAELARLDKEKTQLENGIKTVLKTQTALFGIAAIYATQPPGKRQCKDGKYSDASGGGVCSYHGGLLLGAPKKQPKTVTAEEKPVSVLIPSELITETPQTAEEEEEEAQKPDNYYIVNEDNKAELHFYFLDYKALDQNKKNEIKKYFLWGKGRQAWVSKGFYNTWGAQSVIKMLNLPLWEKRARRSFADEVERKKDNAEYRSDRYEAKAQKAVTRAESLQSEFNRLRKDWSWITQPNINTSRGRSFTRARDRVYQKYERGFEELKKSDYFMDKAGISKNTAAMKKYEDLDFVARKIKETEKSIKAKYAYIEQYNKALESASDERKEKLETYIEDTIRDLDYLQTKHLFLSAKYEDLVEQKQSKGKFFTKERLQNEKVTFIKEGRYWHKVIRLNATTVSHTEMENNVFNENKYWVGKTRYEEIQDISSSPVSDWEMVNMGWQPKPKSINGIQYKKRSLLIPIQ